MILQDQNAPTAVAPPAQDLRAERRELSSQLQELESSRRGLMSQMQKTPLGPASAGFSLTSCPT
jgi:hypothetical protein